MLRRVFLVRTYVSEELIASIIKVTIIGILGKLAVGSSEASVLKRATRHNIQENGILQSHRRENLKSSRTFSHSGSSNWLNLLHRTGLKTKALYIFAA
jgi:hypothetical protein